MEIIDPKYTRVSQILSIFQAYSSVPPARLKRAQDIGTAIHGAIEAHYRDGFCPLNPKIKPYFESFLKFDEAFNPKALIIEERFYDKEWMITGRIDLLARIGGESVLVDFKTGSWAHPEIWKLQGTFYRHLIEGTPMKLAADIPNKFMFVQLKPDGSAPEIFEFTYDFETWTICGHALMCYRYFSKGVDGK